MSDGRPLPLLLVRSYSEECRRLQMGVNVQTNWVCLRGLLPDCGRGVVRQEAGKPVLLAGLTGRVDGKQEVPSRKRSPRNRKYRSHGPSSLQLVKA